MKYFVKFVTAIIIAVTFSGCQTINDERIPAMAVNINLSEAGTWNTYGVNGYGIYRYFIKSLSQPSGFRFLDKTYTGFGGVLLIGGMDPYTTNTNVPLAYDLACPVERKADVRVQIDKDTFEAICPVCGSKYDVTMAGGSPLSGTAASQKYGLRRYTCVASAGGYIITN